MARLIVQLESGRTREYEAAAVNTIGRHPMQSVQVLDPQVSKEHLVVERKNSHWLLRDLGSLNGTYLNDELVTRPMKLKHRDKIQIGGTVMIFSDPQSIATGDHKVTIGDNVESSICEAYEDTPVAEFQPAESVEDPDQLRRDYEKLRLAAQLHNEIALEYRLEVLLPRILDHLMNIFKSDRGVILLADDIGGALVPRAVRVRGDESKSEINLSKTIINKVITEKKALLTNDAQRDNRFSTAHSVIITGIRSTICAPLMTSNREVLGVIHLDSVFRPNAFTEQDLAVLQGVCQQAAIAISNSRLVRKIEEEAITRQKFEKMLSPNLVERVVSGDLRIEKGGELRQATVMFTDIRGFTSLTEKSQPQAVVKMLNEYFEVLVDIAFEHGGTLDKYIGDSMMALWGVPVDEPQSVRHAVLAAIEIQKAMIQFNELRALDGQSPIQTGIGIATGEIVVGYMGSSKTMNYTVVGPSVNLAARLCAVAQGGEILIGDSTYQRCGEGIEAIRCDPLQLKGFADPVPNWSVTNSWGH